LIARENFSENIENLPGALGIESFLNFLNALEDLSEYSAFAGIGSDEVEDEAVFFLAVSVDVAHPLFKSNGVPRDVVVDYQPAKLQVNTFAGSFRCDQYLTRFTELPLGVDAGAGRITITDLHPAMNLRDR